MTWNAPGALWLLLATPLFALAYVGSKRIQATSWRNFGRKAAHLKLTRLSSSKVRAARGGLFTASYLCVVVALAGPQFGGRTIESHKRGVDLVFALDFSKSMLAEDVTPSRIERAKAELIAGLDTLTGDRVGVVAFAGETMSFPLTTDYEALKLFLRDLSPLTMPVGGTSLAAALSAAHQLLFPEGAEDAKIRSKVLVLLTDGEDHAQEEESEEALLRKAGAHIFVISIGSKRGEFIPLAGSAGSRQYLRDARGRRVITQLSKDAEQRLRRMAQQTGGTYARAQAGADVLGETLARLRRFKQSELKAKRVTVRENRFELPLVLAFLLLLAASLIPDTAAPLESVAAEVIQ